MIHPYTLSNLKLMSRKFAPFAIKTTRILCTMSYMCFVCRELFNAAFVSCWMELRPIHQEDLVTNLKQALSQQNIPEITQTVLNLAEFMEHCEDAVVRTLGGSQGIL